MGMVKKFLPLILVVFVIFGGPIFAKADGENIDVNAINTYLKKQMKVQGIEGLSYAIVKNDRMIYSKAFGMADFERKLTPKTPMKLASLSKSFTALAIMQLVEQGKVNLDAPVKTYIPWFQLQDKDASQKITIRQLLNQTSAISGEGEVIIANELQGKSLEETVRLLNKVKLSHSVGSTFEYTNLNYLCLGLVVEKVSGESLAKYDQEHILTPLKMNDSFTSVTEAQNHGLSKSYTSWFGLHLPTKNALDNLPNFLASGYMVSSAEDMAKYLQAYMNNGAAFFQKRESESCKLLLQLPKCTLMEDTLETMQWGGGHELYKGQRSLDIQVIFSRQQEQTCIYYLKSISDSSS
jgi:CubicO group peptidase (beta-lactamase class C family)